MRVKVLVIPTKKKDVTIPDNAIKITESTSYCRRQNKEYITQEELTANGYFDKAYFVYRKAFNIIKNLPELNIDLDFDRNKVPQTVFDMYVEAGEKLTELLNNQNQISGNVDESKTANSKSSIDQNDYDNIMKEIIQLLKYTVYTADRADPIPLSLLKHDMVYRITIFLSQKDIIDKFIDKYQSYTKYCDKCYTTHNDFCKQCNIHLFVNSHIFNIVSAIKKRAIAHPSTFTTYLTEEEIKFVKTIINDIEHTK